MRGVEKGSGKAAGTGVQQEQTLCEDAVEAQREGAPGRGRVGQCGGGLQRGSQSGADGGRGKINKKIMSKYSKQ